MTASGYIFDNKLNITMTKGRVKITDIAKELGVSTSTVSRALSNEGRISTKTRKAVENIAKKWGYKPNPFAVNLLKKKSKNIGLILPEFTHHYFSKVLSGVNKVLSEKGYHLIINTHEGELEKEKKAIDVLNSLRVDGIIASYARETVNFEHYLDLMEDNVPLVFLDRMCEDLDTSYVVTDDFQGCIDAINYLAKQGQTRIAHIQGPNNLSTSFNRMVGYKEALKLNHLMVDENLILQSENDNWKNELKHMVISNEIDAILCFNDYLAFESSEIIKSTGKSIPEDIALIGFADEPLAKYMSPKLTTIMQPAELMGQKAAEILLWHIDNPEIFECKCKTLPTRLIKRESTKQETSILKPIKV